MKKNIVIAMLAYILFFIPLLTEQKNDPFVKYHTKQGFVLFVAACLNMIIFYLPIFHWFSWLISLGIFVLFITGLMNAASGKEKPLPLIGQFAGKVKFL